MTPPPFRHAEAVARANLDPALHRAVSLEAVALARTYFQISAEFETFVFFEPHPNMDADGSAYVLMYHGYEFAELYLPTDRCISYANAWRSAAHEVAHLVTRELNCSCSSTRGVPHELLNVGIEQATTRLERMFMRDHPFPGISQFQPVPDPARDHAEDNPA